MLRCGARRRNPARFGERGAGNVFRRGGKKTWKESFVGFCWFLRRREEGRDGYLANLGRELRWSFEVRRNNGEIWI